jgi:hypothetical protein
MRTSRLLVVDFSNGCVDVWHTSTSAREYITNYGKAMAFYSDKSPHF